MEKFHVKKLSLIFMAVLLGYTMGGGSAFQESFESRLGALTEPYRFSFIKWQFGAIFDQAREVVFNRYDGVVNETGKITDYFVAVDRLKAIKPTVEAISTGDNPGNRVSLEKELDSLESHTRTAAGEVGKIIQQQIRQTLYEQGIFNPVFHTIGLKMGFPPVSFKIEEPLYLLVISPRNTIERMKDVILKQSMSLTDIEELENKVDELGVSSLVVQLGGFAGVYPTFVTNQADLRFTIDAAIEEWVHQYLAFKPLGFRYLLDLVGIAKNNDIGTMNETVAGMVSREIGAIVYQNYYKDYKNPGYQSPAAKTEFDFNQEMRKIRKQVDEYLARGDIGQAETYMEQKRQYLTSKGHYVRKLNQAYFAFYGVYADAPGFVNPIGTELQKLRGQSVSLSDFLEKASSMTSRKELTESVTKGPT